MDRRNCVTWCFFNNDNWHPTSEAQHHGPWLKIFWPLQPFDRLLGIQIYRKNRSWNWLASLLGPNFPPWGLGCHHRAQPPPQVFRSKREERPGPIPNYKAREVESDAKNWPKKMTQSDVQISSNIIKYPSIYLSVYLSIYLFIYLSNVSIYHIQYISYSIHVHVCTKCGVSAATRFTKACRLLFEPHKNAETHPHLFTLHEYNIPVDYKKYHSYEVSKYKITINNVRSPRLTIQWIGHVQSRNQRNFPPLQASWLRP